MKTIYGAPLVQYLPSLGFLAFTLVYLAMVYGYEADARAFPSGVAWVMLVLVLLDLVSRSKTAIGGTILRLLNPASEDEGPARGVAVAPVRQLYAILWMFGFAVALFVIGVLPSIPIYVFAFMRLRSGLTLILSITVAALTTVAIWLVFGLGLRIDFYQGLFFEY
jgi:hypothetical protein